MYTKVYESAPLRAIAGPWALAALATLALVSLVAMQPPLGEMRDHGAGFDDLQYAGTTEKATELVGELGDQGRRAAWIVLAIELPFLIGFGLLIAGWSLAVADRLAALGRANAALGLRASAWCGPLAAGSDLIQNVAVAFMIEGSVGQPAPRVSEVGGYLTWAFVGLGAAAIAIGISILLFARRTPEASSTFSVPR